VSKSVEDPGKPEIWSRTLCKKRTTYGHDLTPEIFLSIHNFQVWDEAHPPKKKNSFRSSLWLLTTYQLEVAKG